MPLFRQLLVAGHTMDEGVTRSTQPRDLVEHVLFMPSPLERLGMYSFGYKVMVRKRDPVAVTYLTCRRTRSVPRWWIL